MARLWLLVLLAVSLPAAALEAGKPFRDYVTDTWGVDQGLPQISVLAIAQDPAGYLWFGTQTGLARFDGVRFVRYTQHDAPELGNNILALLADDNARLWIGTSHGLLVLEDERFRAIAPTVADRPAPASALLKVDDRILVGCAEGICAPQEGRLRRVHVLPEPALSLLARDDGLWAGGEGRVFHIVGGKVRALPLPAAANGASVTALAQADGDLWAGTRHGLFRLRNGSWQAADGHLGDALTVEAMQADRDGNLWLGSMVEGVTRAWNGWARRLSQADGLEDPLLWSIAAAPDGGIWVGSSDGVAVWRDGRFRSRVTGNRLPHPEAYSLLPERDQTWIGTRAGVAVLRGDRLEQPAELAPLRDAQINGIVRDRAGRLWFATTHGLFLLEDGKRLTRYGEREGLA
ncbi:MAG: GGDEF domain-containing protein, partial [Stenotrophomonas nitritireducens]|nr:GGDEF domain-containing protein [Stenotrophomonas nitritireducens]